MAKVIVNGDVYDNITEVRLQKSDSAGNVSGEQSFFDTLDANATGSDLLSGKTAYANGAKISGSISSKSAETYTPGRTDQTISSGQYLSGTQTIKGDDNLQAQYIKDGVTIFNVEGTYEGSGGGTDTSDATARASDILDGQTAYARGSKLSGAIPSKSAATYSPSTTTQTISAGQYLAGAQTIAAVTKERLAALDGNFVASNIKNGVSVFGLRGEYSGGSTPSLVNLTVTPTESVQTFNHSGYDGYDTVTVNAIQTETKSATPTAAAQTIMPTSGKYLTSVTVAGDAKLIAANIKKGVTIFGVTGNYGGASQPTQQKTVTPSFAGGATTYAVNPDSGYLLSKVTISKDANLIAGNIKRGVTIFGVTGTYDGGGGGESYSIVPSTQTFYHNQYVTLGIDIAADGTLIVYKDSGGGTVTNPKICTSMSSTFDQSSVIDSISIPQSAGEYTLPIVVWWGNTSGQNNDHTSTANPWVLNYTVIPS